MGFFDKIFGKKNMTLEERMNELGEQGAIGKLERYAVRSTDPDERIAAYKAMSLIRGEDSVGILMDSLKYEEDEEIIRAILGSLNKIGTKRQSDELYHYADMQEDEELAQLFKEVAVSCKDRTR